MCRHLTSLQAHKICKIVASLSCHYTDALSCLINHEMDQLIDGQATRLDFIQKKGKENLLSVPTLRATWYTSYKSFFLSELVKSCTETLS
jgi:hypothetical protein